ncbi:MAG: alcohol dehydrogenase catalytic domain-containing protein [Acidaminobacter sp.]|uniref:zinc-dependent alcohol dehydrogenase n=1 Tax=Acidaminobacter sp. TaxID=1872102 RepID=UPI00137ED224|nr:alcohol dehydrogenase catalytic domain-containing protein [Acidaminobacter sp.]MZQ99403.1 alcohol dehydrogenase catalytic domain-containing protein [Acidaminobacter sp.]
MKAIRFTGPETMEYVDVPKPVIEDDEVLIKVMAVGICGTDLELFSGEMPYIKNGLTTYPLIPGHEWSGQIVEIGSKVTGFKVGDRVTGDVSIGCGNCSMCMTGRFNLCPNRRVVGSYRNYDGAFAEYLKLPYRHVYPLPNDLSYEEAALIEPAATAAYGVMKAGIGLGETVLVIGDGPIGLLSVQTAVLSGASKVFLIGSWEEKLKLGIDMGASIALNYRNGDIVEVIQEKTQFKGVDVVIETSGSTKAFNQSLRLLKPGGKIVLLSIYTSSEFMAEINSIVSKDAEVIGVLASCNSFKPTIELLSAGKIDVLPLITHCFPLEQAKDAIDMMRSKKDLRIKVLLIPSEMA